MPEKAVGGFSYVGKTLFLFEYRKDAVYMIYPAEYGAPRETESSGGGKVTLRHQEDEKNGGGVMFYTLSAEASKLENDNKITITQSFQNKEKVRIVFIPAKMEDAFKKEY